MAKSIYDIYPDRITKSGDCWLWTAGKAGKGYGIIGEYDPITKKTNKTYIHRLSYEMSIGVIPDGYVIMHRCDIPNCCNPEHLTAGTQKQNIHDAIKKKRFTGWPVFKGSNHGMSIVTEDDVKKMRKDTRKYKDIADDYGLSVKQVSKIKLRQAWTHVE